MNIAFQFINSDRAKHMTNSILEYYDLVSPFNQTKILSHIDKLRELKKQQIVAPICSEIDLTDGFCNNKCKHCFF